MDDADFTSIDQLVFDRLHSGSLGPIVVHLKDGGTVTGELLAVHRSGAVGGGGVPAEGTLCLATGSGHVSVRYDEIGGIA